MNKSKLIASAAVALAAFSAGVAHAYTIASIEGGSSAFLGTFGTAEGALPQVIAGTNNLIANYRTSTPTADSEILATVGIVDSSGNSISGETADSAEVRYLGTNIIILVKKDSGQGVRYITNGLRIGSWSNFKLVDGTTITPSSTGDANAQVAYFLTQNTGAAEQFTAGLSDVTADSIARYSGISNPSLASLTGLKDTQLGVITWLPIYNYSGSSYQLDLTRANIQNLIDDQTVGNLTSDFHREQASGTRITEILDIQNNGTVDYNLNPPALELAEPEAGTQETSTGNEITAVNATANSFGYAFVTGAAGTSATSTYIAAYYNADDLAYYSATSGSAVTSTASRVLLSTATNYGTTNAYPGVTAGVYPLWSYENYIEKSASPDLTAESIASVFSSNTNIAHSQGVITVGELEDAEVYRDYFTSTLTGEKVYDGQAIDIGGSTEYAYPGNLQQ